MTSLSEIEPLSLYVAPKELVHRWQVSRSSVKRIAQRQGFKALFLGEGKNSSIRYSREEVEAYEANRQVTLKE